MRKVQFILLLGLALCVASCRTQREPIIETRTEVQYETKYVERLVRDTLWVDVPAETATNVTPADSSHIETNLAASDAWVDPQGLLHHTLNNKAQSVPVPYQRPQVDVEKTTKTTEAETIKEPVYIEKPLTAWQTFRLEAFWWLVAATGIQLLWAFRKPLLRLILRKP